MSQLSHFCHTLTERAAQHNIRHLVVVKGGKTWASKVVETFSTHYSSQLFCGEPLVEGGESVPFKQAKLWLGRECQMLTINGHHGLDAQALGALSGTIVGGGVLLLLLPDDWFEQTDSNFCLRLNSLLQQPSVIWLTEKAAVAGLSREWIFANR